MQQMQQVLNQLLQLMQQGVDAIFRFVHLIWSWSVDQIMGLTRAPWGDWPLWKQVFLVLVIAGVVWALFRAAKELWDAAERILAAFATLLAVCQDDFFARRVHDITPHRKPAQALTLHVLRRIEQINPAIVGKF